MSGSIGTFNIILEAKAESEDDLDKHAPQIQSYLRRSTAPFGILTNGRRWRLYPQRGSSVRHYYEVDMIKLLDEIKAKQQDDDAFSFFYDMFRKDAFPPAVDVQDGRTCFLDQAVASSQLVTNHASAQLPKEGFAALQYLCQFSYIWVSREIKALQR